MIRASLFCLGLAVLFTISSTATASTDIAIDALHGLPNLLDYQIDLEQLYPEYNFVSFDKERIPLTNPIRYGLTRGSWEPTNVSIEITEPVDALYLILDIDYVPGVIDQLPFVSVIAPDQGQYSGNYAKWHIDHPTAGTYQFTISWGESPIRYQIGTGPSIWDAYPPEDYDAVLYLNGFTWMFFRGLPTLHSDTDLSRIQDYLDNGGGYGLIYDAQGPIAMKPVIRVLDFESSVDLTLDVPGKLTYRKPQVKSEKPVRWSVNSANSESELLYEVAFKQPLNFIYYETGSERVTNRSWAVAHDVILLEFIPYTGYRITELGTLLPGAEQKRSVTKTFSCADMKQYLEHELQKGALASGMTDDEASSFFSSHYNWIPRILSDVAANSGPVCLYRIENADYDGLIPLQADPKPYEQIRVLWIYSMLPEGEPPAAAVHPKAESQTSLLSLRDPNGVIHEYGVFREHYGSDALDELDEWNWHCYDGTLADTTNFEEWPEQPLFHTTGGSPLASTFMDQVQNVQGMYSTAIAPLAGDAEVVLKGDDDTFCWDGTMPYPAGSYPPVVVAREETEGGRLTAYADLNFFDNISDNVQFNRNMLDWLTGEPQDPVPDIDIADAVVETTVVDDQAVMTLLTVTNRGEASLTLSTIFPADEWFTVVGPTDTTLSAGDEFDYGITWNSTGLTEGFHTATWTFSTNDPNEASLEWPVTMQVVRNSGVHPTPVHPESFVLHSAYPNPFNSQVSISFSIDHASFIEFTLINVLGQETEGFTRKLWPAGTHQFSLDFSDKPSGLYVLKADDDRSYQYIKLMHLK
jgi:hypothetical protein